MKNKDCFGLFLLLILVYLLTSRNNLRENFIGEGMVKTGLGIVGLDGLIDTEDKDDDVILTLENEKILVDNVDNNIININDVYLKEDYKKVDNLETNTRGSSIPIGNISEDRPEWLPRMPKYIKNEKDKNENDFEAFDVVVANLLYEATRKPEYSDHKDIIVNEAKLLMTTDKSAKNVMRTLHDNIGISFAPLGNKIEKEVRDMMDPDGTDPRSGRTPTSREEAVRQEKRAPPPKSKALFKQKIIDSVVETCQMLGLNLNDGNQENAGCNGASCEEIKDEFRGIERTVDKCIEMNREYRRLKKDYEKNMNKCGPDSCEVIKNAIRSLKDENERLRKELNKMIG
jgi:hypothetical protein